MLPLLIQLLEEVLVQFHIRALGVGSREVDFLLLGFLFGGQGVWVYPFGECYDFAGDIFSLLLFHGYSWWHLLTPSRYRWLCA